MAASIYLTPRRRLVSGADLIFDASLQCIYTRPVAHNTLRASASTSPEVIIMCLPLVFVLFEFLSLPPHLEVRLQVHCDEATPVRMSNSFCPDTLPVCILLKH